MCDYTSDHEYYVFFCSHLFYNSFYLYLTQIQLHMSIRATLSFCCKYDYIRHYLICHKDVLKVLERNIRSTFLYKSITIFTIMHTNISNGHAYLFYMSSYHPVIQIQLHKSIHVSRFSYCRLDHNHRYLLHRMDVLNSQIEL